MRSTSRSIMCAQGSRGHRAERRELGDGDAREVCRHLGLDDFLEFTLGANDTKWKKPNPKLTQFALDKIKSTAEDTIYIGDSPYDYQTAENASMDYFLATTGTHSEEELSKLGDNIKIHPNLLSILPHLIP